MRRSEFILQCVMHMSDQIPNGTGPKNYEKLVGRPPPSQHSEPYQWIKWWADAEAACKVIAADALADRLSDRLEN